MNNIIRLRQAFRKYYGIVPDGIYCQSTGKRMGSLTIAEFQQLADHIVPRFAEGQDEELADEWAMRLFASMRPSMFWNRMGMESMDEMRKRNPKECLAYLMGRLFAPSNTDKVSLDEQLGHQFDRIKLCHYIEIVDWSEFLDALLYDLIRIDAQLGLHAFKPQFTLRDLFSDVGLYTLAPLLAYIELANKEIERLIKRREMETRFYRDGNTLAKRAHFNSFMERKPPSQAKVKLEIKAAKHSELDSLFASISGTNTRVIATNTKPFPSKVSRNDAAKPVPAIKPANPPRLKMPNFAAFKKA